MRLAIFGALPSELKWVIKELGAIRGGSRNKYHVYYASCNSIEISVVITSVGGVNALAALESIFMEFQPDAVLSTGYGGALYKGAEEGELVWASDYVLLPEKGDAVSLQNGNACDMFAKLSQSVRMKKGTVVTVGRITGKKDVIGRLSAGIQNPVCDMETFMLAEFCLEKDIRFFSLRAISDLANQDIPLEVANIVNTAGVPDIGRAIKVVLRRPWLLFLLIRLASSSRKASENLWPAVRALIGQLR
jgi:adenosylhomocysteine nucleosidase